MPTRLIREGINDSRAVNALSEPAEVLYRRLMSIVDDYGRYEADPDLIRARCFPRQLDRWKVERVAKYLNECSTEIHGESPLVTVYSVGLRKYLQINNFGQRLQAKSKFPAPEDGTRKDAKMDDSQKSTVNHGEKPPSRSRSRSRISESESGVQGGSEHTTASRGSRLRIETLPAEWAEWCQSELGWAPGRTESVFPAFRDWWISKAGNGGIKLDWFATWRNWCRKDNSQLGIARSGKPDQSAIDREWESLGR
jgi:hypothetical protein